MPTALYSVERADKLLHVENLRTTFATEQGLAEAVHSVSFEVQAGEVVGLVGESGCGKSVTANSIMRLLDGRTTAYAGKVLLSGEDVLTMNLNRLHEVRGAEVAMVFQDPMTSLNPVYTVGEQIAEMIRAHPKDGESHAEEDIRDRVIDLLRETGIPSPEERYSSFPHELSGGMRQRVVIAMAVACRPALLIADEPTTALDVTTQAQILELIHDLSEKYQMGTVLITHDLGVVAQMCDRVNVMYLGQIIETGLVTDVFTHPSHPYTRGLLAAIPKVGVPGNQPLVTIPGRVPSLFNIPSGCRFAPRCQFATELCTTRGMQLGDARDSTIQRPHRVRCIRHEAVREACDDDQ